MHDPRVGRFFAVDPLASKYPHNSPYAFSENRVIDGVELEGLEYHNIGSPTNFDPQHLEDEKAGREKAGIVSAALVATYFTGSAAAPYVSSAYGAYSTWFGTTQLSNYLATGTGAVLFTQAESIFTYRGFFQSSFSLGAINGTTNLMGQFYSNDFKFDENINWSQPVFASFIKNPFYSNLGESFFTWDGGSNFDMVDDGNEVISTFGSNYLGGKFGSKLEVDTGYKPISNVLNTVTGTGVEVIENTVGDSMQNILNFFNNSNEETKHDFLINPSKPGFNQSNGSFGNYGTFGKDSKNE